MAALLPASWLVVFIRVFYTFCTAALHADDENDTVLVSALLAG